ncbi:MAG TPA: outer membrane lipoprotein-sorting protein [Opitutaceae bacterium]
MATTPLDAQQKSYRPLPRYAQGPRPDQAEGRRILEEFRQLGIAGDYFLEFQLRVMPRRGDEHRLDGRWWGSRNAAGAISRLVVLPQGESGETRLLVQNGVRPAAWRWSAPQARPEPLGLEALFDRVADTDVTIFDLQMPFLHWNDFVFEGVAKVRGRPAQTFLLYPPAEFSAAYPALTGVRVFLDLEFHALVQAEQIGAEGRPLKAMTVLDLKKIGDQWIVKSIDLRDETTRNKTRFSVTGAALNLDFSPTLFSPEELSEPVAPPAAGQISRIAP